MSAAGTRQSRPERWGATWPALVVGVLAATVTALGSWIPSLWGDEAATVLSAERTLPSLWAMVRHLDAMHAAYYLLMHFWIAAFGASAFSVRFPSALAVGAGAAGLVVLMRMLRRRAWVGVLAATVFVALPRIQYIGQEARSFAWDAALITWTIVAFVAVVQGRMPRRWGWAMYGVGVAVSTVLFPYDISVIAITAVVLVPRRNRPLLVPWAVSSALALLLAAPALALSVAERGQVAYLANSPVTPSQVFVSTWFGNPVFAALAWVLAALGLLGGVLRFRRSRAVALRNGSVLGAERGEASGPVASGPALPPLLLLASWAFLPALVLLVTQPVIHNFAERYVAFCAPAVAALIAEGATELWRRALVAGLVAVACLLAVAIPAGIHQRTPYSESGSDWAQVAGYVHARARAGDDILFAQTVSPAKRARNSLRLYPADFRGLRDVALTQPWYESDTSWHDAALTIPAAVSAGRVDSARVWVVETRGSRSEGLAQLRALGYRVVSSRHFDLDTVFELTR